MFPSLASLSPWMLPAAGWTVGRAAGLTGTPGTRATWLGEQDVQVCGLGKGGHCGTPGPPETCTVPRPTAMARRPRWQVRSGLCRWR